MSNSKYSNDLDTELDRLVFLHEDRSDNPGEWCCLREPSVRETIKALLEQTRSNTIKAAIAELPEKWILKQEDWHKYDTMYQEHDKAIDQAESNLKALIGGDV